MAMLIYGQRSNIGINVSSHIRQKLGPAFAETGMAMAIEGRNDTLNFGPKVPETKSVS